MLLQATSLVLLANRVHLFLMLAAQDNDAAGHWPFSGEGGRRFHRTVNDADNHLSIFSVWKEEPVWITGIAWNMRVFLTETGTETSSSALERK